MYQFDRSLSYLLDQLLVLNKKGDSGLVETNAHNRSMRGTVYVSAVLAKREPGMYGRSLHRIDCGVLHSIFDIGWMFTK